MIKNGHFGSIGVYKSPADARVPIFRLRDAYEEESGQGVSCICRYGRRGPVEICVNRICTHLQLAFRTDTVRAPYLLRASSVRYAAIVRRSYVVRTYNVRTVRCTQPLTTRLAVRTPCVRRTCAVRPPCVHLALTAFSKKRSGRSTRKDVEHARRVVTTA